MRDLLNSLFPRLPGELEAGFHEQQRMLARALAVAAALVLLIVVPLLQLAEYLLGYPGGELLHLHFYIRLPLLALAVLILLLRWFAPEGRWPRPVLLSTATVLVALVAALLLAHHGIDSDYTASISHSLIMALAAVAVLATRGVRDLVLIYGLPTAGFVLALWWLDAGFVSGGIYFLYPLLTMLVGATVSQMLYLSYVETYIATRELERHAITDPLTDLFNRRAMGEFLSTEAARAERHDSYYAVLMADIDRFKRVNDIHGHEVGDQVLRQLSHRLKSAVRREDQVGRWGGEEFIVLLQGAGEHTAARVAEKIRSLVARTPFETSEGELDITLSIGAAVSRPQDTVDDVIGRADEALYRAKDNGRNRVEVAESP